MVETRFPRNLRRWPWAAWAAAFCLGLLFELPTAIRPQRFDLTQLRPTLDLLALLTLSAGTFYLPRGRKILRGLFVVGAIALVVYRLDQMIFYLFMRQEPLLYDQLHMLRHLFVLIGDLWNWGVFVGLICLVLAVAASVWGIRWILRRLASLVRPPNPDRATLWLLAGLWSIALLAFAGQSLAPSKTEWVRWLSVDVAKNVQHSLRIYRGVQQGIIDSPYTTYETIEVQRTPDIRLFFVESYGRVLLDHPSMRLPWLDRLERMDRELANVGWHSASGFSRAPIAGGRSWLAEANVLTGINVRYEAEFRHVVGQIDQIPNLVTFLERQGYENVLLTPSERTRPGVVVVNHYDYDRVIRFHDLDYHGPVAGWGIIPDQYSLHYAHETFLVNISKPLFLNFHMVTSHAPWQIVPEYVEDWRTLAIPVKREAERNLSEKQRQKRIRKRVLYRLGRYERGPLARYWAGELTDDLADGYLDAILYDIDVIAGYLADLEGDQLVIVMGDHQPPFIAQENAGFDVPVHILTKDPALLQEFLDYGFTNGLQLHEKDRSTIHHQAFFSLFVRALARCCGDPSQAPPVRKLGVNFPR